MSEPLLRVEGLSKSFGAVRACRDVSLELTAGELHALIGPNGAGKTTVLNQISGDLTADSGRIELNGRNITSLPVHKRARLGMARSYQITSVFENLTVRQNLALAIQAWRGHSFRFWQNAMSAPDIRDALGPAMERVDLSTRGNVPAGRLSHGEKRQLEVGMVLVGRPKILLLDEPMAGMGPGGAVELSKLIRKLKQDVTILLVEHDMRAVFSLADRITVMVYGETVACGAPEQIRTNPDVQQAYLGDEAVPC